MAYFRTAQHFTLKQNARDKANLDITWLRDPSRDDADSLPAPEVLAADAGPCRRKP